MDVDVLVQYIILGLVLALIVVIWSYVISKKNLKAEITKLKSEISDLENQLKICEEESKKQDYKLQFVEKMYPHINSLFDGEQIVLSEDPTMKRTKSLFETVDILKMKRSDKDDLLVSMKNRIEFLEAAQSNLSAIPYMSAIMSDYETYSIEVLAKQLDWGHSYTRSHKVQSIREIRKVAQEMVEKNYNAKYQLAYLLNIFPTLEDVLETEYEQLPVISLQDLSEYDKTRDWLSKEEYQNLDSVERNQLALDRYKASHSKSKWQIGRDYELYVGFMYSKKGYSVDYFGSTMGLKDLGRDLIVSKGETVAIIQCKYWSQEKTIHEKHILQLYGTIASYKIENNLQYADVQGVLITNICLSDTAKKMADYLKILYVERYPKRDYPCIKCNIGKDAQGQPTKIYHLPFDQQYDATQIKNNGEFFAMTVKEAEDAGFRRAFKWFGNS